MANTNKTTKREYFGMVRALISETNTVNKDELIQFIDHEVELLARKSSSKGSTANQKENMELKSKILDVLRTNGAPMRCGQLVEMLGQSQSKISAMLSQMGEKGTNEVVKEMVKIDGKGKAVAMFSVNE